MKEHHVFLESRREKIEAEEILPPEVYSFYCDFFKAQHNVYLGLSGRVITFPVLKTGLPLVDATRFAFAEHARELMREAFADLAGVIMKHNDGLDFSSIIKTVEAEPHFMENLAMKLLARDNEAFQTLSTDYRIDADELIFLTANWLKPYFVLFAEKNADTIPFDDWDESRCPVCGYFPDMALLKDSMEGKRCLHCALCETEWPYRRLACTICGEENTEKLGYFAPEDASEYRVDFCQNCHGYVKTRRISKGTYAEDYDLTVENILTVGFDSSLIEKGYTRP